MSEPPPELRKAFEQSFAQMALQAALVDGSGRIVLATDSLAAQLLREPEALRSAAFDTIFSPRNPAWLSRQIRATASSGVWAGDAVLKRTDGTEWWAHIQACRAPSPPGGEGELLLHVEDVTERIEITTALMKRAEELYDRNSELDTAERRLRDEMRRASRLASVGEMLAGAAHSFGNVLMALQGTVESARAAALGSAPTEEVVGKLDRAADQVSRGAEILRRLLSFSRGAEEQPGGVMLHDIAEAAVGLCRTHPAAKQRTVTNAVPHDLPLVEARPGPLQEVFLNLVLNALQATEPGGEVRLEAEVSDDRRSACLRVIDNGSGMAPETVEHAFEPFFSTKGGTGLGLPTSAAAIHRMGGVITVDSRAGEGTVFTIRLNLKNQATSAQRKVA